jgi:Pyridoxamine 5'-phosphate oxidase
VLVVGYGSAPLTLVARGCPILHEIPRPLSWEPGLRSWAAVAKKLDAGSAPAPDAANSRTTWLSTVNQDGSPHVTAVGALWVDGTFWLQTGAGTRKGRNVARDPRCSVAVSIRDADVVIEGDARRVTGPGALARIAQAWAEIGWPAEPDESGAGITAPFKARAQGPPP